MGEGGEGGCTCSRGGWTCWRRRRWGRRAREGDCWVWVRVGDLLLKSRLVSLLVRRLCFVYLGECGKPRRGRRQIEYRREKSRFQEEKMHIWPGLALLDDACS